MPSKYYCHFCGRGDSLNAIPDTAKWVCSSCWEIIVHIVGKFIEHSDFTKRIMQTTINNYENAAEKSNVKSD